MNLVPFNPFLVVFIAGNKISFRFTPYSRKIKKRDRIKNFGFLKFQNAQSVLKF